MCEPEIIVTACIGAVFKKRTVVFLNNFAAFIGKPSDSPKFIYFKRKVKKLYFAIKFFIRRHIVGTFGYERFKRRFRLCFMLIRKTAECFVNIRSLLLPAFFDHTICTLFPCCDRPENHALRESSQWVLYGNLVVSSCPLKIGLQIVFVVGKIHFGIHSAGVLTDT